MTEKDKEIQELRRENSLLRRQRDLFKERMFSYARSMEKLESERGRLESEVETLQKDRETILDALDAAKADIEKLQSKTIILCNINDAPCNDCQPVCDSRKEIKYG